MRQECSAVSDMEAFVPPKSFFWRLVSDVEGRGLAAPQELLPDGVRGRRRARAHLLVSEGGQTVA